MYFWLCTLTLVAPVGVVIAVVWLAGEARQLTFRDDTDMIVAIRAEPGPFNPLAPGTGVTREISELIFDRLLRLDDDLRLQPHLITRWQYQHRATCYFLDEEKAAAGAAVIDAARDRWPDWGMEDFVLDGDMLHLVSTIPDRAWLDDVTSGFEPETLAPLLHVRLRLKEAVEHSLRDFLSGSVEKGKLRHVESDEDRVAHLYLQGDTDLFLKELRLYYESNRNLEPEIEVMGPESRLADLHFEMDLRDDLKWHDGEPVTADDLVFTFEEITRAGSPWALGQSFDFVSRLEKIDDYRVRAHYRESYAPALERWAKVPLLPSHLLGQNVGPAMWDDFFRSPVGTGPYRLEMFEPGRTLTLAANPDYLRGVPRQPRVRYVIGMSPGERRLALRLGNVDLFSPDPIEQQQIEAGSQAEEVVPDVGRYQSMVAWNLDRPRFANPKVRQALAHLIDLDELIGQTANGRAEPWTGLFFPGSWFCEERPGPLPHDPEMATQLFTEAGWQFIEEKENDAPGYWADAESEPIRITLSYDVLHPLHTELANALGPLWKKAGIEVILEPIDWRTLIEDRLAPREFDALLLGWELDFSRDHFAVWHSSQASPGGTNFSGLRNQEVDGLLEKIRLVEDEPAVIAAATELQNRIRELQPCLFLCGTGRTLALRKGAVKQSRQMPDGMWSDSPVSVGRAGLFASRPWWVRAELLEVE